MQILSFLASAAALGFAFWILFQAYREFVAMRQDAHQLTHDLEVADSVLARVTERDRFAETFQDTSAQLLDLEIFGPVWDEFRESLDVDPDGRVVRSARDPYEFLGPRLLDASDVDQRRIEAVPNRLIAFGLIFTFIGLVLSLVVAGVGLSADRFEEVRAALTTLLFAASVKFITSIAGIASSIWFTRRRSEFLNRIDALSAAIARQLDRLTLPLRADIVAEASHRELKRQSSLLERSNLDLATAIATQLDETLRANLSDAIQPVADRIGEMSQTIADMNQDALNKMVDKFSERLGSAARDHTKRLEEALFQLEKTMEAMPDSIARAAVAFETAGARFSSGTEAAAAAIETRLAQAGNALAELLDETEKNLGSTGLAFAQVADLLGRMVGRIEQTESASSERAQRAEETLGLAVEQLTHVLRRADTAVEILAPLTPLAERLEQVAGSLVQVSATHAALIGRGEALAGSSQATAAMLSSSAAAYAEKNARLQESLTSVFEELAAGIDLFRSRIAETVELLDEDAARIVETLELAGADGTPPEERE